MLAYWCVKPVQIRCFIVFIDSFLFNSYEFLLFHYPLPPLPTHTHTYINMHTHIQIHTHTCTHTHAHTHTHTHTHSHTHTGTKDSSAAGLQTYSSPLQGLVSAAKAGASTQIPDCATILSERANRLVQMARSVASAATSTPELSRYPFTYPTLLHVGFFTYPHIATCRSLYLLYPHTVSFIYPHTHLAPYHTLPLSPYHKLPLAPYPNTPLSTLSYTPLSTLPLAPYPNTSLSTLSTHTPLITLSTHTPLSTLSHTPLSTLPLAHSP